MKQSLLSSSLLLLLFYSLILLTTTSTQANNNNVEIYGKVAAVQDGDTITLLRFPTATNSHLISDSIPHQAHLHTVIRIRLRCIDAPELDQEPHGLWAKKQLEKLILGQNIRVVNPEVDKHGRWLGEVFNKDNVNVNQEMVRIGAAFVYCHFQQNCTSIVQVTDSHHKTTSNKIENPYYPLEEEARKTCLGVWDTKETPLHGVGILRPWLWRFVRKYSHVPNWKDECPPIHKSFFDTRKCPKPPPDMDEDDQDDRFGELFNHQPDDDDEDDGFDDLYDELYNKANSDDPRHSSVFGLGVITGVCIVCLPIIGLYVVRKTKKGGLSWVTNTTTGVGGRRFFTHSTSGTGSSSSSSVPMISTINESGTTIIESSPLHHPSVVLPLNVGQDNYVDNYVELGRGNNYR
jgi:micrococcal nuclease